MGGVQRREKDFYLRLNQLGELLDQETKVDRLLSVSLEQSLQMTGAVAGRILLRKPGQDYLLALDSGSSGLRIVPVAGTDDPATSSRTSVAGAEPLGRWLMAHNRSLLSNQVQRDLRFLHPDGEGQPVNSIVAAPMRLRGEAIGLIMVVNSKDGPFDNQDLRMLEAISDRTAMAVERAWLYEAEQTKRRMAEALLQVSQIVGSTLDLDEVLNLVLDCLGDVIDYDSVSIALLFDGTLQSVLHRGLSSQQIAEYTGSEEFETTQHLLREKAPLVIADTRQYSGWVQVPGLEYVRSWIGAPMLIKDKVIGVLIVRKAEPNYYGSEDARVVFALASQVGLAIENARLYAESKRRAEEIASLYEIGLATSSTLDLDQQFLTLYNAVQRLFALDTFAIILYDPAVQEITVEFAMEEGRRLSKFRVPLDEGGLTSRVIENCRPLLIKGTLSEADNLLVRLRHGDHPVGSWLGVPLVTKDRVIGAMSVQSSQLHAFDEDDQRLLATIANQVAIAIQNAAQYEELKKATAALKDAQDRRLAADRLTVLGTVAANFAHRMNNVAGTIPVAIQEVKRRVDTEDKSLMRYLNRIEDDGRRLMEMAEQLRRPLEAGQPEWTNVNDLLVGALRQAAVPENVEVIQDFSENLPTITVIRSQLLEVFINLITNAIEAMPGGGKLSVRSELTDDKEWIEVEVSDTGHGMTGEVQRRIFDLFFTTKQRRMGLGLWWCKTILQEFGGDIFVMSQVGEGSTFTVRVPLESLSPGGTK